MTNKDKTDIQEIFSTASGEVQRIVTSVIDAEHFKMHLKRAHGIKEEIVDIVKEIVK